MNTPTVVLAAPKYHLGFFKTLIADLMESIIGMRFDNPSIDAEYVPMIAKGVSERVEIDLSDFPTIAGESIMGHDLAKSLHAHYVSKIQKNTTGPPQKPS